ncbi:hypothetical protein HD806DRAFT_262489 [Xylariaceae sp. AK1471]|nr:hypothetical protein HD806DRAFT_262489 [Xylariaceae sp. AK1471]
MMDGTSRPKGDSRRRRPALACVSCRKSKIRCDRQYPCGACVRSRHKTCVFDTPRSATSRRSGIASVSADVDSHSDLGPVTPASSTLTPHLHDHEKVQAPTLRDTELVDADAPLLDVDKVLNRLFELERRVDESAAAREPPEKNARRSARHEEQTIESYLAADIHPMSRGVMSKTRYFGQSHWMNGIIHFKSLLEVFEHQSKDAKSEAMEVLNKCKALARTIKAQRCPDIITKFGTNIPPRDVADKLVDAYLRTLETVFRVIHVPSFKSDYEKFWATPDTVGMPFIIQLQLVMAIGCTIYDESFSMRKSAIQWVTEAQYWILGPPLKGKLTITGLQIMVLLTLARETASVGGDLVWIHVGSLLRSAFYMGLHRDPSRLPRMSRLDTEIRRRLWNTILELELKTSIDAGGFPAISPDMSDTRAPADLDDMDLMEDDIEATTKEGDRFTDMTMALALRDSFRERLAIYQMLNATPFRGTYDDTILLHGRFMTAFKSLTTKLKRYTSSERQPTSFQRRFVEVMTRRCLMSLHLPYLGPGLKDPAFAFSRKQVTEAAFKMYCLLFPSAALDSTYPLIPSGEELEILSTEGDDLARFAICAAGFWRLLAGQPAMMAILELQTMLQEDEGLGPSTLRPDILNILRHSLPYYISRIKAGETNIKGYLFTMALAGHVQALMEGRTGPELLEPILSAAIKTEKICFDLLKQQVVSTENTDEGTGDDQFDWDSLMTMNGGWGDNAAMGSFFNVSSVDSFLDTTGGLVFTSPSGPFWG